MLSAVIITLNEEKNIARCLESLRGVVEEIVVVDSFSTDGTEEIALSFGARVVKRKFDGFGQQKNYALQQASFDWVLSLDADEALSSELRKSILEEKLNWKFSAYRMNRLTNYCGQWIRHSGWYPDAKIRLADRRYASWTTPSVHESLTTEGTTGHLPGNLLHYSYYSVEEHLVRAKKYAILAADAMRARRQLIFWPQLLISPAAKFIRNYFLRLGFLDGRAGFTICRIAALETFWKYWYARR